MGNTPQRPGLTTPAEASNGTSERLRDLLERIAALGPVRAEGLFMLEQWVDSAEMGYGGTLVWQAPHRLSKRTVSEVGYIGERATYTAAPR